jgi:hypothetical protein
VTHREICNIYITAKVLAEQWGSGSPQWVGPVFGERRSPCVPCPSWSQALATARYLRFAGRIAAQSGKGAWLRGKS